MEKLSYQLIKGPRITNSSFSLKKAEAEKDKHSEVECEFAFKINYDNENKKFTIKMNAKTEEKWIPFKFNISSDAILFIDDKGFKEKDIAKFGFSSAGPYVFTLIKDFVAEVTRKAGLTPFYLPNIDFSEIPDEGLVLGLEKTKKERPTKKIESKK